MKKTCIFVILTMTTVLGLTACKSQETKAPEHSAAAEMPEDTEEHSQAEEEASLPDSAEEDSQMESMEQNSGLNNFDADMEEAAAYAESIKEAVAEKSLEKLAELTGFPVYVGLEGVDVVETKDAFLKLDPDEVIPEEMQISIKNADIQDLSPSMAGFTLMDYDTEGSPSITFGMVDGAFRITGINYGY